MRSAVRPRRRLRGRRRPPPAHALAVAVAAMAAAASSGLWIAAPGLTVTIVIYLAISLSYSLALKHVPGIELAASRPDSCSAPSVGLSQTPGGGLTVTVDFPLAERGSRASGGSAASTGRRIPAPS
jgi:hypothetical protein